MARSRNQQTVAFSYPYPHQLSARQAHSIQSVLRWDQQHHNRFGHDGYRIVVSSGANITNARNEAVEAFLDRSDADWLWFIDTDMVFDGRDGRAGPDIVDRLVEAAHPERRPVLGALCFSWLQGREAAPTLYVLRNDNKVGRLLDFEREATIRCLTGTGCLLIHRTALQTMREAALNPAYPWFQETQLGSLAVGEDITFCVRAEALGIPVHVDTSIKVGHEKPIVVDHNVFEAQQVAFRPPPLTVPTFAVIPGKNRHQMTGELVGQVASQVDKVFVFDNGSDPPYDTLPFPANVEVFPSPNLSVAEMWNAGFRTAAIYADDQPHNVAVLNNDLLIPADFIGRLAAGLRSDNSFWIAYPNWHQTTATDFPTGTAVPTTSLDGTGRTMSGWAFMVRGEQGLRVDEQFRFWFTDDDLQLQTEQAGGRVVCVGGCFCTHLEPNRSYTETPALQQICAEDRVKFETKWGGFLAARRAGRGTS